MNAYLARNWAYIVVLMAFAAELLIDGKKMPIWLAIIFAGTIYYLLYVLGIRLFNAILEDEESDDD